MEAIEQLQQINQLATNEKVNVSIPMTLEGLKAFANSIADEIIGRYPSTKEKEEELRTVEQTMEVLKVSRTTLWKWERKGFLVPVKLGRQVRYRTSDINQIMEG